MNANKLTQLEIPKHTTGDPDYKTNGDPKNKINGDPENSMVFYFNPNSHALKEIMTIENFLPKFQGLC